MIEKDDAGLVRQCLEGNLKAFEAIIDKYQKTVFNVALRIVNDYSDAEDVAQTVFVKAYENLGNFDPKHKFFSWLYRMTVNESLNLHHKKKRFEGLTEEFVSGEKNPEQNYEESEMIQNVEMALMHLDPEQRALIVLKHLQGLSYKEIAYILDVQEKTVKSRLFEARQFLKNVLLKQGLVTND